MHWANYFPLLCHFDSMYHVSCKNYISQHDMHLEYSLDFLLKDEKNVYSKHEIELIQRCYPEKVKVKEILKHRSIGQK